MAENPYTPIGSGKAAQPPTARSQLSIGAVARGTYLGSLLLYAMCLVNPSYWELFSQMDIGQKLVITGLLLVVLPAVASLIGVLTYLISLAAARIVYLVVFRWALPRGSRHRDG